MKRIIIEKRLNEIWRKHATGMQNMSATYLPHANQKALFDDIIDLVEEAAYGETGKDEEQ